NVRRMIPHPQGSSRRELPPHGQIAEPTLWPTDRRRLMGSRVPAMAETTNHRQRRVQARAALWGCRALGCSSRRGARRGSEGSRILSVATQRQTASLLWRRTRLYSLVAQRQLDRSVAPSPDSSRDDFKVWPQSGKKFSRTPPTLTVPTGRLHLDSAMKHP